MASYKASAPPRGPVQVVPALFGKNTAERSGGVFKKGHILPATCQSAYNSKLTGARPSPLTVGMGLVEGLLVTLHGVVEQIEIPPVGSTNPYVGRALVRSVSVSSTKMHYDWSWTPTSNELAFGGFFNGPTFYATTVFTSMAYAWLKYGTAAMRDHVDAFMGAWIALVQIAMTEVAAMTPRPLSIHELEHLCKDSERFRLALMLAADEAAVAMQYIPPSLDKMQFTSQVASLGVGSVPFNIDGRDLLNFPPIPGRSPMPATPPAAAKDEDLDLDEDDEAEEPTMPETVAPTTSSPVPPAPPVRTDLIETQAWKYLRRGLRVPGAFFVYGRTANGKTEITAHLAAAEFGYRVVPTDFAPGIQPTEILGTLVPDGSGWRWQDGPAYELARAAANGERVCWQLNELPRSKAEMLDMLLIMLEVYNRGRVEALRLPYAIPPGDSFYVWRNFQTGEILVVPVDNLKVVATANFGDRYRGQTMTDPAFRRRFPAGFYEMPDPTADEMRKILASRLRMSPASSILTGMVAVFSDVDALQAKDNVLVMTLNTALLLRWGERIQDYMKLDKMKAADAFVEAATDVWGHMICGVKGDVRDPETARKLLQIVQTKATSVK